MIVIKLAVSEHRPEVKENVVEELPLQGLRPAMYHPGRLIPHHLTRLQAHHVVPPLIVHQVQRPVSMYSLNKVRENNLYIY